MSPREQMSKNISRNLFHLRKKYHVTQEELAKKIGASASTLAMLERGHRGNPSVYLMHQLASYFRVSIESFLLRNEKESSCTENILQPTISHQASGSKVKKYRSGKNKTNFYQVTLKQNESFTLSASDSRQKQMIICQTGQVFVKMPQHSQLLSENEGFETVTTMSKKLINFGPATSTISIVASPANPLDF